MKAFHWLALFGAISACSSAPLRADSDAQSFPQIERGRYLATVGDCTACHTAPGGKPFAGGLAIETPFGKLVSPNITPDRETGIGAWTDDQFVRAMHEGLDPKGRHFYPAFPYPYFTKVSGDDLLAIRSYLATLEPVRKTVVTNTLPFPFNIRAVMIGWNALYFQKGEFQPVTGKSVEWNKGAYLVEGLGHCGACHTSKNFLGGDKTSETLAGGVLQGWLAPDLTNGKPAGLGNWSADAIVEYLHTGHNRDAAASGPMAEVVALSTSKMTIEDLQAMATYLRDVPETKSVLDNGSVGNGQMGAGAALYQANCAACHQANGEGQRGLFPALAKSPGPQSVDPTNLIRVLLEGGKSVATDAAPTAAAMPAFGWKLTDEQMADVVTYIRNNWGNRAPAVTPHDISVLREQLAKRND